MPGVPFQDLVEVEFRAEAGEVLLHSGSPYGPEPTSSEAISRGYKLLPDDMIIKCKVPHSRDDWRGQELGVLMREHGLRVSLVWTVEALRSALLDESLACVVVDGIASKPDSEYSQPEFLADYNSAGELTELTSAPVMLLTRSRS